MLRSLFSGVSGLRAHQTMLDVVGNNIANVNTPGFKSSNSEFEDTLSQLIKPAGAPQGQQGGSNPAQVGLGVEVAAITTNWTQGPTETTGVDTDLLIQGDGFFMVNDAGQQVYTRDGAFSIDANGNLTTADGAKVQGWTATNGVVDTNSPTGGITLPLGTAIPPQPTTLVTVDGNLPADASDGDTVNNTVKVYDADGNLTTYTLTYKYVAADSKWDLSVNYAGGTAQDLGELAFKTTAPVGTYANAGTNLTFTMPDGSTTVNLDLDALTSYGGQNTVEVAKSDGASMGSLQSYSISPDGTIEGSYTNGLKQPIGQIAMATFKNPQGLQKVGNSEYTESVNSGQPQIGTANTGSRGSLVSGALEGSNVDLSQEFSNLIIAERGFEANSKVITTSDQVLQDLVNLKQ